MSLLLPHRGLITNVAALSPAAGGGGGGGSTFNSADKAALTTLSGGDLIATRAAGGDAYANVRSTSSKTGNGKFVVKVTNINAQDASNCAFGIGNAAASLTDWVGNDANTIGSYPDGSIWVNGSSDTSLSPAPGEIDAWYAFELLTSTVVVSRSIDGTTWASTDPVARPTGPLFIFLGQYIAGDTTTIDFAPTGWTLSGASNWD